MFEKAKMFFQSVSEEARKRKLSRLEKKLSKTEKKLLSMQDPQLAIYLKVVDFADETLQKLGHIGPAHKAAPTLVSDSLVLVALLTSKIVPKPQTLSAEIEARGNEVAGGLTVNVTRMVESGLVIPTDPQKIRAHCSKRLIRLVEANYPVAVAESIVGKKPEKAQPQLQKEATQCA